MDLNGGKRQLIFRTGVGMYGMGLANSANDYGYATDLRTTGKSYGPPLALCKAIRMDLIGHGPIAFAGVALLFEDTVEKMLAMAQHLWWRGSAPSGCVGMLPVAVLPPLTPPRSGMEIDDGQ